MSTTTRERLRSHPPRFLREAATPVAPPADIDVHAGELAHGLACRACGYRRFRVLGVPAAMSGESGGFVLRSALRVWRELRVGGSAEDEVAGRLSPPIVLECTQCSASNELVLLSDARRARPLEALRCRPCRRSTFEAAILCDYPDADLDTPARADEEERFDGWRLVARCITCGRPGEPFATGHRSEQRRRLDRLYGREVDGATGVDGEDEETPR